MSKLYRIAPLALSASVLALAVAAPASAAGFYLQEQSVRGLGRAYSGEAADTGAESLWWNPAAIAGVEGIEAYAGTNLVLSDSQVRDRGTTIQRPGQLAPSPVGGEPRAYDPLQAGVIPNLDAAWRVNDHLALGLAVSAPFDFTTQYDPTSFVRYQALTSRLLDLDIQPTVAVRVNRYLDVGVGFDAQYAKSTLSAALPNLSPTLPDGINTLKGDGWNYGWTAGAQLHPTDRFTLGASYRSQIEHTIGGTVTVAGLLGPLAAENGAVSGTARFTTPWIVVVGGRYVLDRHWALNVQVQRVGWSVFKSIRIDTAAGTTVIPEGYHDTTTEAVGVDYTVNPKWTLRSGIAYDPTPTPNAGRSARVPDGDRWMFSVGTTVRPSPRVELVGALSYVRLQRSQINGASTAYAGTAVATAISYDGEVTGDAVILSSGVKFRF
ncbi:MAG: outer membrane protein transport protein [Caulobacteraceae bacterium]|nr:outer membrane protein transport protein [Caulobacteraceae bacterium]